MPHRVEIHGTEGKLRWGYQEAASLRDLTVIREADGWKLTATIAEHDEYAVSQRPLVFEIPTRGWRWDVLTLQVSEKALSATLGPQR